MRDNDFRLLDPEEAVAWGCLLIFLAAYAFAIDEPKQIQPVARTCDVTISQYGPGERWYSSSLPSPACAGAVVPAPNHILSTPMKEADVKNR